MGGSDRSYPFIFCRNTYNSLAGRMVLVVIANTKVGGSVLEGFSRSYLSLGGVRVFLADYLKAFLALGGHSILTVGTGKL